MDARAKPGNDTPACFTIRRRSVSSFDHLQGLEKLCTISQFLKVGLRDPDATALLSPGQRQEILPGRIHRVVNTTPRPLRYLLIQGTGAYDFNEVK